MQNEQQKTKGYLIANFTIHDQETFKKYVEAGSPLAAKFNGKDYAFNMAAKVVEANAEGIWL